MSSYEQAMIKLSRSGNRASETFYRVVANMAVRSEEANRNNLVLDTNASKFTTTPQITGDIVLQCTGRHRSGVQNITESNKRSPKKPIVEKSPKASSHKGTHSPPDVQLDISAVDVQEKISEETEKQSEGSDYASTAHGTNAVKHCPMKPIVEKRPKASSHKGTHSPPDVQLDISAVDVQEKISEETEKQSEGSDYESTAHGTNAVFSEMKSSSHSMKVPNVSQRPGQRGKSTIDQSMRIMKYHMGRISFQCECHFEDIPLSAMSKADRRHCRRFHRGLLGRKKAEERRNSNLSDSG